MSYKIYIDNVEKESDEWNWIYISDDKDYDKRYQIGENFEERMNDDIAVSKLGRPNGCLFNKSWVLAVLLIRQGYVSVGGVIITS